MKHTKLWELCRQCRLKSVIRLAILIACSAMVIVQHGMSDCRMHYYLVLNGLLQVPWPSCNYSSHISTSLVGFHPSVAKVDLVDFDLTECFSKLLSPPISTYTGIVLNKTMSYPALTICRSPPYKMKVVENYNLGSDIRWTSEWVNFPFGNRTLEQFWSEATYTRREMLALYALHHRPDNVNLTSSMFFLSGQCYTLHPQIEPTRTGRDFGYSVMLRHSADEVNNPTEYQELGWNVYIHDAREPWTENRLQTSGRQEDLFLEVGEELQVKITVQDYRIINEPHGRCNPSANYSVTRCEDLCHWDKLVREAGCGAPWLNGNNASSCDSYEPMKQLIIGYLNTECHGSCCSCIPPCRTHRYTPYVVNRKPRVGIFSQLYVFYGSKIITKVEEHISYDWSLFLADLGGSLGFLLGISVLGIVDVLERGTNLVVGKIRRQSKDAVNRDITAVIPQKF